MIINSIEIVNEYITYQEMTEKNMLLLMEEIFMIIQLKVILTNIENLKKSNDWKRRRLYYRIVIRL